jgi:septum formation protein
MKLILASASPRRAEVLRDAGITFDVRPSDIDETRRPGEPAQKLVVRLAEAKARAASLDAGGEGNCIVIGADTVVELDSEIFGKPRDAAHAAEMLGALSARTHQVLSGIFLLRIPDGATRSAVESTSVTFAPVSRAEIENYIATGEPLDKAGSYAIQGRAGRYISRVEGCYFNVVGLPLARLRLMLGELGWPDDARS